MPDELVAHTGMDALTHSFEAYASNANNPFTDALAVRSIEMIKENLLDSYKGDKKARSEMHIAQALAGMAFSNAILGIVHSMAHKSGAIFEIPHGCANAIFLPYAIEFNRKEASVVYADIAKRLDLAGNTEDELVDSLVAMVQDFNKELNIPSTLKEFGLSEEVFKSNLDEVARTAVDEPCTGTNPREISVEQMKKLFSSTFYGEAVDF